MRVQLSPGVELRPLERDDAPELSKLIESNRAHLARWMPWAADQTAAGTRDFVDRAIRQKEAREGFQAALLCDGAIAGVAGFHAIDRENATTSIGYWLAAERQGRGLMTATVSALLSVAFDEWGLHRVEVRIAPDNQRSHAIVTRLGFRQEGLLREAERFGEEFRDLVLYALLADDWRDRAPHVSGNDG